MVVTSPSYLASTEKSPRDLLTLVAGALASLVLIGTSLAALNKNVIGFRAWPGTSSEPTPVAVLPAAEPAVSSTRATFGFTGPSGTSSLAIVGLPGAGLPGFRSSPVAPGVATGISTRTTIGEAPVGPPAPQVPVTPTVTPAPVTGGTPIASAAATAGPVPASITAPAKTTNPTDDDRSDRKAGKGRRKERAQGKPTTSTGPKATVAAAPTAASAETTREWGPAASVTTKAAPQKGKATPQRRHVERTVKAAPRRKEPRQAAPAVAPTSPAAVAPPAPASGAAPSAGPQSSADGPQHAGRPDKGPKGGKGRGPA